MSCESCPNKISHSRWSRYMTCPQLDKYHSVDRLRPESSSSALAFGTAVDAALNYLLLSVKRGDIHVAGAINVFRDNFKFEDMDNVRFEDRDFDKRLLEDNEIGVNPEYNAWKCLRVKGRLLIEAYVDKIIPQIEEVESVQEELRSRPGVIDTIVKLRGHGRVILDNKTSVRPYDADAVTNDTQLALYCEDKGIEKAAFAVMVKQISFVTTKLCTVCKFDSSDSKHKTCPNEVNGNRCHGVLAETTRSEPQVQLLVGTMPTLTKELITSSISEVERAIESGIYPKNLRSCGRVYGQKCVYFDKCWNGSDKGLQIKQEEK